MIESPYSQEFTTYEIKLLEVAMAYCTEAYEVCIKAQKDKEFFISNKDLAKLLNTSTGNIFKLLGAAIEFASSYLPVASTFFENDYLRKDIPLFPILALREAIANSLIHRDYSTYGGSMSFAIYDDRLEIWNYGLPPGGVSANDLPLLKRSTPRNPNIANVLYYHKIFESWGRGVQMIIEKCQQAGHPTPFYELDPLGTTLILPSKQLIGANVNYNNLPINLRQQEIINVLNQYGELTKEEIQQKLSYSISERRLRDELNKLKEASYIIYTGSTKTRKWLLK